LRDLEINPDQFLGLLKFDVIFNNAWRESSRAFLCGCVYRKPPAPDMAVHPELFKATITHHRSAFHDHKVAVCIVLFSSRDQNKAGCLISLSITPLLRICVADSHQHFGPQNREVYNWS
jgi:hypothetical protein